MSEAQPDRTKVAANRYVVFALIAVLGFVIDLVTKNWIFGKLGMPGQKPSIWLIDNVFGFTLGLNQGALFGMGQGFYWLFALLASVAAVGILYWLFWLGAAREWQFTIALAAITAGIFGNLYDRLGLPGLKWNFANPPLHQIGDPVFAVRDWLHFKIDSIGFDWPLFNIADSLLVCGAGLLILHAWLSEQPKPKITTPASTAESPAAS